ncbi:MAG: hypothetical protein ABWY34_10580 [Pseudoxanthomonas sp.]
MRFEHPDTALATDTPAENSGMGNFSFKDRVDLDRMIAELDNQLEELYRHADAATRPEIWAKLTNATLKLVAPEDQDYAYDRLYAVFKARQSPSQKI